MRLMSNRLIRAIIFDWHGVLDQVKLEDLLIKLAQLTGLRREAIADRIKPIERSWAKGEILPREFWRRLDECLNLGETKLRVAQETIITSALNVPLWQELPTIGQIYRLAILSDNPLDKVRYIRDRLDLSLFEQVHFSSEKNQLKDSPKFFEGILNDLSLSAQECLYVDDNPKHCATAAGLGFKTCLFNSVSDLIKSLPSRH